jgi:hypothetical protein
MLYNKAWDTKTELLTLAHFIQWLESKDPNAAYPYIIPNMCAGAQYLKYCGVKYCSVGPGYNFEKYIKGMWKITKGNGHEEDWTFGAALERAKAIQNGTPEF